MSLLKKKKSTGKKDKVNSKINNDMFDPIFGIPLSEAAKKSDREYEAVPSPIRKSVEWLNKYGLKEEGLYRVPGSADVFKQYQYMFDHGHDVQFIDEKYPENVTMIIVKYLQELPEPIYTTQYEAHFKIAFGIQDTDEKLAVVRGILLKLPYPNRETIKVLCDHLRLVVQYSDINKMSSKNIGLTWSLSLGTITGTLIQLLIESDIGAPSTIVFNVPLHTAVENSRRFDTFEPIYVPNVVTATINWLIEHESYKNELFVEKGNPSFLETYKRKFNSGEIDKIPDDADCNDIASLLQLWLSELKDGLIPEEDINKFKRVSEMNPKDQRIALREIFDRLPSENKATLKIILGLFCRIISNSFLIDALCLASVISPSLRNPYSVAIKNARSLFNFDFSSDFQRNKSSSFGKIDELYIINSSKNENSDVIDSPKRIKKIRKNKSDGESQDKVKIKDSMLKQDKERKKKKNKKMSDSNEETKSQT